MNRRELFIFGLLLFLAVFLFSYNLSWGAPYFFHPDERNIAFSVHNLAFPTQLNPHFFAYGSLPIYCIYLLALFKNALFSFPHFSFSISYEDAIIASRLLSNFLTYATIILLFIVGKKMHSNSAGLLASFLGIFSIGFIQFAHFGTFEMWLTFFYLLLFYRFLFFLESKTIKNFFFLLVISGVLLSIKISSLILLLVPFSALIMLLIYNKQKKLLFTLKLYFLSFCTLVSIFLFTNPYVFFDFTSFFSSIQYESRVATGAFPVFYTGGFFKTTPILYQLFNVYPFLLNPIILLIGIISFGAIVRKKNTIASRTLFLFFLIYFLSQAFLFVKWTRYLVPTLPFFYLSISLFIFDYKKILANSLVKKSLWILIVFLSAGSSFVWGISYSITAFYRQDTRIAAAQWAERYLPHDSKIVTEVYDLGTLPFSNKFLDLTQFNFYDLDVTNTSRTDLQSLLSTSDFLLLPSQRIVKNRISNPTTFPVGNTFYATVRKDTVFEKVYETPCDIFCVITYVGDPIFRYEETASVFDRPTVILYRIHEK